MTAKNKTHVAQSDMNFLAVRNARLAIVSTLHVFVGGNHGSKCSRLDRSTRKRAGWKLVKSCSSQDLRRGFLLAEQNHPHRDAPEIKSFIGIRNGIVPACCCPCK